MLGQTVAQLCFDFLSRLPIVVEPKEVSVSSDTGILPIRQFDSQIGFTGRFLVAGRKPRDDDLASQPTLSRFENVIDIPSLRKLHRWFSRHGMTPNFRERSSAGGGFGTRGSAR